MPYEYFKFKSAFQFQCPGIPIFSPQMDLSSLRRNCSSVNSFNICSSCNYSKNTQTHPKKKHPKIPTVTADRLASPHRSKTRNKYEQSNRPENRVIRIREPSPECPSRSTHFTYSIATVCPPPLYYTVPCLPARETNHGCLRR